MSNTAVTPNKVEECQSLYPTTSPLNLQTLGDEPQQAADQDGVAGEEWWFVNNENTGAQPDPSTNESYRRSTKQVRTGILAAASRMMM